MIFDSLLRVFATCHDDASRFVRLLAKPGRMVLEFDDLVSVVQVGAAIATVTVLLVPVHLSLYVLSCFGAVATGNCPVDTCACDWFVPVHLSLYVLSYFGVWGRRYGWLYCCACDWFLCPGSFVPLCFVIFWGLGQTLWVVVLLCM